jgi:hypothetical protein
MRKNPYPTHMKDQPNAPDSYDKNAHASQGGVENLPSQQYDTEDDNYLPSDAKTWSGTDRSVFE